MFVVTPKTGNNTKGNKLAAGTGMASVAHHEASKAAIATVFQAARDKPSGAGDSTNKVKRMGPSNKPTFWYVARSFLLLIALAASATGFVLPNK